MYLDNGSIQVPGPFRRAFLTAIRGFPWEKNSFIAFLLLVILLDLILLLENPQLAADKVKNAGSVFLGAFTPESAGDYASGTNHTLPTNGYARSFSGVSLDSFMKKITFQEISKEGLNEIGPAIEIMAEAEQLRAHKQAVSVRLDYIKDTGYVDNYSSLLNKGG